MFKINVILEFLSLTLNIFHMPIIYDEAFLQKLLSAKSS